MTKRIILSILALACASVAWGQQPTTKIPSCGTKKSGVVRNITGSMPFPLALCTPSQTGQYRLTANKINVQHVANSPAVYTTQFSWYDGAGIQIRVMPPLSGGIAPPNSEVSDTFSFATAVGSPITYWTIKSGIDISIVNLYWTVELLDPLQTF